MRKYPKLKSIAKYLSFAIAIWFFFRTFRLYDHQDVTNEANAGIVNEIATATNQLYEISALNLALSDGSISKTGAFADIVSSSGVQDFPFEDREEVIDAYPHKSIPIGHMLNVSMSRLVAIDHKNLAPTTKKGKFFREVKGIAHLDQRFGSELAIKESKVSDSTFRLESLKMLLTAWALFCDEREIPYNIAHGVLLGWFWGQKLMPFDDDLDVQVPGNFLVFLKTLDGQVFFGRYLIEVNPKSVNRVSQGWRNSNHIDARFIDQESGYFIDITGLSNLDGGSTDTIKDKSPHTYHHSQIYPLVRTTINGIPVWRPFNVDSLLKQEYGPQGVKSSNVYQVRMDTFLPQPTFLGS